MERVRQLWVHMMSLALVVIFVKCNGECVGVSLAGESGKIFE